MDPVSLIFYAIVCGLLGLASPNLGGTATRLGVGAGVGVLAAATLPLLKGMMGY